MEGRGREGHGKGKVYLEMKKKKGEDGKKLGPRRGGGGIEV